jgi:Na+-transporting NADH:ubiquinone oxidoreductase subunit NqrB
MDRQYESLEFRATKLQDKFLKNIDDFFQEYKYENIMTPITTLLGTVIFLLGRIDKNNKFSDDLIKHTERMLMIPLYY